MKKSLKFILSLVLAIFVGMTVVACGMNNSNTAESITLSSATLDEVEFENADTVKLKQTGDVVTISGKVDAMSDAEKSAFGASDVTHAVVLKYTFDKEKTVASFKIKGNNTKVFSSDNTLENYSGTLSDLLDSQEGEDAYCYLILSANTKTYTLTATYTDKTESVITVKINATLATAEAE